MMIEGTLFVLVMAVLFGAAVHVGEGSSAKLDAAYESRAAAFYEAAKSCPGTTASASMTQLGAAPNMGSEGDQITQGQGRDSTSLLLINFARGASTSTVSSPVKASYTSESIVGCVPANGGVHEPKWLNPGDDPTSMEDQFPAVFSFLGSAIQGWTGLSW